MDYCAQCRRHLNGALACPGCGAPAGGPVPAAPGNAPGGERYYRAKPFPQEPPPHLVAPPSPRPEPEPEPVTTDTEEAADDAADNDAPAHAPRGHRAAARASRRGHGRRARPRHRVLGLVLAACLGATLLGLGVSEVGSAILPYNGPAAAGNGTHSTGGAGDDAADPPAPGPTPPRPRTPVRRPTRRTCPAPTASPTASHTARAEPSATATAPTPKQTGRPRSPRRPAQRRHRRRHNSHTRRTTGSRAAGWSSAAEPSAGPAGVDHAEAVALGVGEDDEVRVRLVSRPSPPLGPSATSRSTSAAWSAASPAYRSRWTRGQSCTGVVLRPSDRPGPCAPSAGTRTTQPSSAASRGT